MTNNKVLNHNFSNISFVENNIKDIFNKDLLKYSSLQYIFIKNKKSKLFLNKNIAQRKVEVCIESGKK